jgi:hypothetical protein
VLGSSPWFQPSIFAVRPMSKGPGSLSSITEATRAMYSVL